MALREDWTPRRIVRSTELLLSIVILGILLFLRYSGRFPSWAADHQLMLSVVFFAVPTLLGVAAILSVVVDNIGIGSVIAVGSALLTLSVVASSLYVLMYPPKSGGVYGGHLFSFMAAILLAVTVVVRPIVNRRLAWIWFRRPLIHRV